MPNNDLVQKIACAGTCGKNPQNCERDLHTVIRTSNKTFDVPISHVRVRTWDYKEANMVWTNLAVINPDDLALCLWEQGERVWRHIFFGGQDAGQYWFRIRQTSWFQDHVAASRNNIDWTKAIPVTFYGDEVATWKNTESGSICAVAWGSEIAFLNSPASRYLFTACFAEQLATEFTFPDLLQHIVERLRRLTDPAFDWPWTRAGYTFIYLSTQGDLKYLSDRFHIHNFRQNAFCDRCHCYKVHENIHFTLGDFSEAAQHWQHPRMHDEWVASTPEDSRDPLAFLQQDRSFV